jgi:hypothetical protein
VPVVSNSSPLIALVRIQRLDLVPALVQSVLIPPAVAREISPSIPVLPRWISVQAPTAPPSKKFAFLTNDNSSLTPLIWTGTAVVAKLSALQSVDSKRFAELEDRKEGGSENLHPRVFAVRPEGPCGDSKEWSRLAPSRASVSAVSERCSVGCGSSQAATTAVMGAPLGK